MNRAEALSAVCCPFSGGAANHYCPAQYYTLYNKTYAVSPARTLG